MTTFMEFRNSSQDFHPLTSLSYFFHFCDGILEQSDVRKELFILTHSVQRLSTMVEKAWWQDRETHCIFNQEAEKPECWWWDCFPTPSTLPSFISIRVQIVKWWCLHLGWVFPLYPVKPLWKHPHRQAQNYTPYMILNAVKLIIKVNRRISYVSSENIFLLWRMRKARSLFFLLPFSSSFPSTTFSSFWILSVTILVTIFILIGTKF